MSDAFCSDCKRQTEVVFDHSTGDTVCSECGLVLESHSIDETSELENKNSELEDRLLTLQKENQMLRHILKDTKGNKRGGGGYNANASL